MKPGDTVVFARDQLDVLLTALKRRGYALVGPTVRDGAITYEPIEATYQLPVGWGDDQDRGFYRLRRRGDQAVFGFVVGPHSWKKLFFPPSQTLWRARREGRGFTLQPPTEASPRYALIGVRACELHAIAIQDKVLAEGEHVDPGYRARREAAFVLAVNCTQPGGTCFCASLGTGPKASSGFDLSLTELLEDDRHVFLMEVGSQAGAEVAAELGSSPAGARELAAAAKALQHASAHMGRGLDTRGLQALLYESYDHPLWERVAQRCLACASCTMVCPTCFCSTVQDTTDLTGTEAERRRVWDSCFSLDFSYIHGGSVRTSVAARYRQWLTHKLAAWHDQFGSSGCVGCGRCITWCPVGIDITEQAQALRPQGESQSLEAGNGN